MPPCVSWLIPPRSTHFPTCPPYLAGSLRLCLRASLLSPALATFPSGKQWPKAEGRAFPSSIVKEAPFPSLNKANSFLIRNLAGPQMLAQKNSLWNVPHAPSRLRTSSRMKLPRSTAWFKIFHLPKARGTLHSPGGQDTNRRGHSHQKLYSIPSERNERKWEKNFIFPFIALFPFIASQWLQFPRDQGMSPLPLPPGDEHRVRHSVGP